MTPGVRLGVDARQYWVLLNISDEQEAYGDLRVIQYGHLLSAAVYASIIILLIGLLYALTRYSVVSRHETRP